MSYDFDYMYVDWYNDILEIVIGSKVYIYSLTAEMGLYEGGKNNGVEIEEYGKREDIEDREDVEDEEGTMFRRRFTPFEQHFRPY